VLVALRNPAQSDFPPVADDNEKGASMIRSCVRIAAMACAGILTLQVHNAAAQGAVDNSALASKEFREHKRTFGLVYTLPKEVNDTLNATVYGLLREKLLNAKLYDEAQRLNIPHVTVLHIHNSDPATPEKSWCRRSA
jgi:hypothetical protein